MVEGMTKETTILYVDDEPDARELFEEIFESQGFKVLSFENAEDALAGFNENSVDIAIIDLTLGGGMNGFDLLSEIRSKPEISKLPVIMLSGHTSMRTRQRALDSGVSLYVEKPYHPDELRAKIEGLL